MMSVAHKLYVALAVSIALIVSPVYSASLAEVINPNLENDFIYGSLQENSVLLHTWDSNIFFVRFTKNYIIPLQAPFSHCRSSWWPCIRIFLLGHPQHNSSCNWQRSKWQPNRWCRIKLRHWRRLCIAADFRECSRWTYKFFSANFWRTSTTG